MYKYVGEHELQPLLVLSKIDRLTKNDVNKSVFHAEKIFFGQKIFAVSAVKGTGIEELRKEIGERVK